MCYSEVDDNPLYKVVNTDVCQKWYELAINLVVH